MLRTHWGGGLCQNLGTQGEPEMGPSPPSWGSPWGGGQEETQPGLAAIGGLRGYNARCGRTHMRLEGLDGRAFFGLV